jgi:hypothetical protein
MNALVKMHQRAATGQTCMLTFLATTSSLATDLTAAGGEGMGDGALARLDISVALGYNARGVYGNKFWRNDLCL